ncbi:MAG: PAS domain-containing protein [Ectothiorhodospiraceae bacterium]|nr:PAS domain-containing protein [Ectothiorhodospiraceae bacterium]
MRWFKKQNISTKLVFIIFIVSFVIVTLVGGMRIIWEIQQTRQSLTQELMTLARLIGDRSSAALAFNDIRLGRENLASLRELPHLRRACLYRIDGSLLSDYQHDIKKIIGAFNATTVHCPPENPFTNTQSHFGDDRLHINFVVRQDGIPLGWLFISSDLTPIYTRLNNQITFSVLALVVSMLLSVLLATWLQRLISGPIKAVTNVARAIEEQTDRHLRAPVCSHDEVGQLALSFNAMLDTLEAQNQQIVSAKADQKSASARYQGLVESTSAIPWEFDLISQRFIFVGRQAEKILGYPVEDWHQKNFWQQRMHPDDMEKSILNRTLLNDSDAVQLEYRTFAADGRMVWIHDDVQVIFKEGKAVRLHGFMFDISKRKKLEEELRKHRNKLETLVEKRTTELQTANDELEAFSYSISHDLRAPLRSISGFSQILLDDYRHTLDSEGQGFLNRVVDNTTRMSTLIDDLLELAHLGKKQLSMVSVNFDDLVSDAVKLIEDNPEYNSSLQKVEFTCSPLGVVTADKGLLKAAINNLLGNAWKYTSKINKPRIKMGKINSAEGVTYFIKDNGAGFDIAYMDKIFVAFQRLHKRDEFEGTGIGLATVSRIIHRHEGRIWAEAEVGKGATFYFTLSKPE